MNRLTDNDINIGYITLGKWKNTFALYAESGDHDDPDCCIFAAGFGWAVRLQIPRILKPFGKYGEHSIRFGASISNMGNGYDFVQVFYGPQTHDSSTEKNWCKHLPWKQWRCVRWSVYTPDGEHFGTEQKKGKFFEFCAMKQACPTVKFVFEDFDGERIVATCTVEEREWHRGEGWFKWLRLFWTPMIRRSLDISFSSEVGCEKGSWKGGTIGHGIDMLTGETPRQAFERYCSTEKSGRGGRKYSLKFIGGTK